MSLFDKWFSSEEPDEEEDGYNEEEDMEIDEPERRVVSFKSAPRKQQQASNLTALASTSRLVFYKPVSYEDTVAVVDQFRSNRPVIINILDLIEEKFEDAQRVHDFLDGAAYALDGKLHKIDEGIYCITPSTCTATGYVNPD